MESSGETCTENESLDDKKLYMSSANYLHNVVTKLNGLNIPTLKSIYSTKLRAIEMQKKIQVRSEGNYFRCKKCLIRWTASDMVGNCKLKSRKLTKFARSVLSKNKRGLPLTVYQRKYYKILMKKFNNNLSTEHGMNEMVLICKFCKNVNRIAFTNHTKPKIKQQIYIQKKNKKKQKTDKFCGLNKEAVISSTLPHTSNRQEPIAIHTDIRRGFETAPFISLNQNKRTIKLKPKKDVQSLNKPVLSAKVIKKKKKNLDKLGNFLKNSQQGQRTSSNLKEFLKAL